jgi:hypothetical protein
VSSTGLLRVHPSLPQSKIYILGDSIFDKSDFIESLDKVGLVGPRKHQDTFKEKLSSTRELIPEAATPLP